MSDDSESTPPARASLLPQYCIISGSIEEQGYFEREVKRKMWDGWRLVGGLIVSPNGVFYQAVARYER